MLDSYKNKIAGLQEQLANCRFEGTSSSSLVFDRTTKSGATAKRKLSLQGQFAVAVRRNVSQISSSDLAITTMDTFTRYSVNRHECKCADALKNSMAMLCKGIQDNADD